MAAVDQILQFEEILGLEGSESWLNPPVEPGAIGFVEDALGVALPEDLQDLWHLHNGGELVDGHYWVDCMAVANDGILELTRHIREDLLTVGDSLPELFDLMPGPNVLAVAAAAQVFILYDMDDVPGRLLYVDVLASPMVIPLAISLEAYFEAWVAVARAGYVRIDGGPIVDEPLDEVRSILLAKNVCPAPLSGIGHWFTMPESNDFEIR